MQNNSLEELAKLTELLQLTQSRLDLALSVAHIGIWDWNLITNDLFWDDNMHLVFGTQQVNFTHNYLFFRNCVHPDDIGFLERKIDECISHNVPYNYTFRVKVDDSWVNIQGRGQVIRDIHGKATRMLGVCIRL